MKSLSWLKEHSVELAVGAVSAALPAYLLRFHIGPIPMTGLEVVELGAIISVIARSMATCLPAGRRSNPLYGRAQDCHATLAMTVKKQPLLAIGSAFILVATIIGIAVAPDKMAALGIAKAYFWEPMILAWLVIAIKPDKEKIFRAALAGLAVSALIVIVYSLIQFALPSLIPATWSDERRITSVFSYPNAAALFLAPLTPLFLSNPIGAAFSAASLITIILAKSAGGLIAAAAAFFVLGIMNKKTRLASVAVAILACAIVFFAPQAKGLREQVLMQDWSGRVHRIGWSESWAMLKDHPLFGAGLSGYPTAVAPYHHAQGVEIFQYPHNLFMAIWSELGLLGLAGFALVFVWFFRRAFSNHAPRAIRHALIASLLAILVHGLVDVPYFKNDLAMMFWLLVVLVAL